jgi:hypothetical protein
MMVENPNKVTNNGVFRKSISPSYLWINSANIADCQMILYPIASTLIKVDL